MQCENFRSFARYLRNVTVDVGFGKPDIKFLADGTLRNVELKIMNLRPGALHNLEWEEVRPKTSLLSLGKTSF